MLQEMARYSTSEPASEVDRTEQTRVYCGLIGRVALEAVPACARARECECRCDGRELWEGRRKERGGGGKSRGGLEEGRCVRV